MKEEKMKEVKKEIKMRNVGWIARQTPLSENQTKNWLCESWHNWFRLSEMFGFVQVLVFQTILKEKRVIEKDETPSVDAQNRSDNRGRPFGDVCPSNPT